MFIDFTDEQKALSLRVTAHTETPGIGDFIEHRKPNGLKHWMEARLKNGPI